MFTRGVRPRAVFALVAILALGSSVAAYGAVSTHASHIRDSVRGSAASAGSAVASLPKSTQGAYVHLNQPIAASVWGNFKPKAKPPWVIGYSSEYAGNSWRLSAINYMYQKIIPQLKKAGLVKKVITLQSNLSDTTQIQQIRQLVNDGANAIFTCCASASALNGAIAYAHAHGVPFFTYSGYVTSPYAINTSANYVLGGEQSAASLAKAMHYKGNVLDVTGIPGATSGESLDQGMRMQMAKYKNIHIVGSVAGQWTDSIVKTQVQKFLATHPEKINGIFVQSPGETGALEALQQSGRPIVPMNVSGEVGTACYWSKHPKWIARANYVWPPSAEIAGSFSAMIRTLEGQGPKIQSMIRPPLTVSLSQIRKQLPAKCSTNSTAWLQPDPNSWFPVKYMNGFFKHGANPLAGH